jgi:AcrR family transcriptional regulator
LSEAPARAPSRSAELTRRALIDAATSVFAEHGYAGGSVRLITEKAKANQAAINYHFGGKEGLYREVLAAAGDAFEQQAILDETGATSLPREQALRLFLTQYLAPLTKRDRIGRYLRIFAWERVSPTEVAQAFNAARAFPIVVLAQAIVRRFLPADADQERVLVATLWLVNQPIAFVRDADVLARPPFNLRFDEAVVARLVDQLSTLCSHGLTAAGATGSSELASEVAPNQVPLPAVV